jgi:uncharacterized protein YgiM (DUF1202 family)
MVIFSSCGFHSQGRSLMLRSNVRHGSIAQGILCAAFFLVALSMASVAEAQLSVPHADFVVAKPVVNMYSKPTADSDVVSQALYGTGVLSLEKQGDWYDIHTARDGFPRLI